MPFAGASGSFSGAPAMKAKDVLEIAREQLRSERPVAAASASPDQCRYSPASFVTFATGIDFVSGPMSIVLPVRTNGAM